MFRELKPKFAVSAHQAVKCFKSRELCTEASSRAGFGSRLKTWTAEEQQSEKCGACLLCALCCVRGPEALGFPRGPSKTNVVAELRAPRPWPAMVQTVQQRETALREGGATTRAEVLVA